MNNDNPPTIITIQNASSQKRKFEVKYKDTVEPIVKEGLAIKVKDAIEGFSKYIRVNSGCVENITQVIKTVLEDENTHEYDEIDFLTHLDIHQQQETIIDAQKCLRLNSNLVFHGSIEPKSTLQIAIFHSTEIDEPNYLTLGLRIQNFGNEKLPYHLFDLDDHNKNNYPYIRISSRSNLIDYKNFQEILKERGKLEGIIFNSNNELNNQNEITTRLFIKNSIPLKAYFYKMTPQSCIEEYQSIKSIINIPFIQDLRIRNLHFVISGQIEPLSEINLIFRINLNKYIGEIPPRLPPKDKDGFEF